LRILYVSHTHPPKGAILDNAGGMQRVSRQLIDELQKHADVELHTETKNVAGRGLVALQTVQFLIGMIFMLPSKARKFDADIILFSSMVTASLAFFIRKSVPVPMVTINHGRDVTLPVWIFQKFVPKIFKALDGVISVSQATRQECIKRGMAPQKGVALPNGFNFSAVKSLPDKQSSRTALHQKFGIPLNDKKMLLTVGRMVKRKGHEWFIREVFPKIKSDVVYVTVGDGPEFKNVQQAVEESPQGEAVFLLGRQPDAVLQQAYVAADLFIMPNIPVEGDMEGFGIVLLEANMAETPAVASDLEGIKDVISAGKNGYRIPVFDAAKFSETVDEVLQDDLEHLSQQTRRYVQQKFSWEKVAHKYTIFLKQVIARYSTKNSKK